jgi:hypothetical protein
MTQDGVLGVLSKDGPEGPFVKVILTILGLISKLLLRLFFI